MGQRQAAAKVTTPDDPVLAEIVRRLVQTYQPERIYLFGSRARWWCRMTVRRR